MKMTQTPIQMKGKTVSIPKDMFMDMVNVYYRIEQLLTTMETLTDTEALKSLKKSKKNIKEGKFKEATIEKVDEILLK